MAPRGAAPSAAVGCMDAAAAVMVVQRPHLVGIGGAGMSGLARWFLARGRQVSGSDARASAATRALEAAGARIHLGHAASHVADPDLVIVSAAVAPDNSELAAALARGIPVCTHAQAIGTIVAAGRGIAVAGTHGKSTTTALVGYLLEQAGHDPTILGGAEMLNYEASVRLGSGAHVVVEADEYDRRFLQLAPRVALVTSVEADHLDYYRDVDEIREAFGAFVARLPADGYLVVNEDDPGARALAAPVPRITYGFSGAADWRASQCRVRAEGMHFVVVGPDGERASVALPLFGWHNVANALGALVVVTREGVPLEAAAAALAGFRGTRRRFQRVGTARGVTVVDDYAHHPTAVRVTLAAARAAHAGPLWVVFQPHTRHRTAAMLREFAEALAAADGVVVMSIYEPVGREQDAVAVSGADLAALIAGPAATYVPDHETAVRSLADQLPDGTWCLTMGAGDVDRVGPMLLAALEAAQ